MKFTLAFDMDGAAFDDEPYIGGEMCRILRNLADRIEQSDPRQLSDAILDINGNRVGSWFITHDA